jgi:hypothetical protein
MLQATGSNLTAVAVAPRDGSPVTEADDFAVTAFVERKLTKRELSKAKIDPFERVFTRAVGGPPPGKVDIAVVESGSAFRAFSRLSVPAAQRGLFGAPPPIVDTQKRFSTLRSGIGIANPVREYPDSLSVGTLGFFVRDGVGAVYLVSNNHVVGKSSDKARAKKVIGEAVVQPGTLDLTEIELALFPTESALVGQLKVAEIAAVVPLQFQTSRAMPYNQVDAAAARLVTPARDQGDLGRLTYGGGVTGTAVFLPDPADPRRVQGDARVYKVGRTTGYTEGIVMALGGVATIEYSQGDYAYFTGQLIIQATRDNLGPFSNSGDSGSGILNARNELVGLLFAGSAKQTLANPITEVLNQLAAAFSGPTPTTLTVVTV